MFNASSLAHEISRNEEAYLDEEGFMDWLLVGELFDLDDDKLKRVKQAWRRIPPDLY